MGRCKLMKFGGSPRIHAGEERLSAPKKAPLQITRFSAGPLNHRHHSPPPETPQNKKATAA
jgi:hypothetical protein